MDKTHRPESFGVFHPIGHTVIALRSASDLQVARQSMLKNGFAESALSSYTPEEMTAQADADMHSASPLASLGQGVNLVRAHRDLARGGCSFLVVHAPDDELAARVDEVLLSLPVVAAQRYGRFIVEELIEQPDDEAQVFESPARGLDIDTPAEPQR